MRLYFSPFAMRGGSAATALVLFISSTISPIFTTRALAVPSPELEEAQQAYAFGDYSRVLPLLDASVRSNDLVGSDRRDAQLLRGRCLVHLERPDEAKEAFCDAHHLDNAFSPPADWETEELTFFNEAIEKCGGGLKWWMYAAAGVVITGVIVSLASGGDGDSDDAVLPGPPEPPGSRAAWR
jgi:hypothetical protein